MNEEEAVLLDAMRAAGFALVTPWHLRCLECFLRDGEARVKQRHLRFGIAMREGLEQLHEDALIEDRDRRTGRYLVERLGI